MSNKQELDLPQSLYTVLAEHYEQGCGMFIMGMISYAESEERALEKFLEHFDDYFARDAIVKKGIVKNEVSKRLFSNETFKFLKLNEGKDLHIHSELKFNFA